MRRDESNILPDRLIKDMSGEFFRKKSGLHKSLSYHILGKMDFKFLPIICAMEVLISPSRL